MKQAKLFDGTTLEFPDETADDVMDKAVRHETASRRSAATKEFDPTEGTGHIQRLAEGTGSGLMGLVRGFKQATAGVGMGGAGLSANPDGSTAYSDDAAKRYYESENKRATDLQNEVDEAKKLDAPLMKTGAGFAGKMIGSTVPMLPLAFVPGANTYAGASIAGALSGAMQPTGTGESRTTNVLTGAALGPVSQWVTAKAIPGAINAAKSKIAEKFAEKQANSVRDATLTAGREAGLVVPPVQVNPSWLNRMMESVGGKAQTQQAASVKNVSNVDKIIKKDLGLADDVALTPEKLSSLRAEAGKAYEELKKVGTFKADKAFHNDLAELSGEAGLTLANPEINVLVNQLNKAELGSGAVVSELKRLRFHGRKNVGGQDPIKVELGRAQLGAADALEGMVERNLETTGQSNLLKNFREARVLIAKTHTAEDALNEGTGHISAGVYANRLNKGKPLTGEPKVVGKMAQTFPKAMAEVKSSPGVSALDFILPAAAGGGASIAGQDPRYLSLIALAGLRPAARAAMLSKFYQKMAVNQNYSSGLAVRALSKVPEDVPKYLKSDNARALSSVLLPSLYESTD